MSFTSCRFRSAGFLALLLTLASFLLPPLSLADRILFKPKNVLSGTLKAMSGGTLHFSTPDSPKVKIPAAKVLKVQTKKPVVVVLKNGARLIGRLVPARGKGVFGMRLTEVRKQKEMVVVPWAKVDAINPPDRHWEGSVSLGGSTQTGNTDRTSLSVGGDGKIAFKRDSFALTFLHNYAEENDRTTARNTYGSFKFEHSFTPEWYWLLSSELLNDKFKNLNLRAIIGPGIGYTIWNDAVKVLRIEGGVSYFSEDLKQGMDDNYVTARIAGNFSYQFTDWLKFKDQALVYPSVEDLEDFKLRNEASIVASMGSGWSIKLSTILEHNSRPPVGVKKDDTTWLYSVQYEF